MIESNVDLNQLNTEITKGLHIIPWYLLPGPAAAGHICQRINHGIFRLIIDKNGGPVIIHLDLCG
jgi:hypothetical protein